MATGLDVAAGALGIVGLAQQLAQSLLKIRSFCKDVKEAPIELQETISSLERASRLLIRLDEPDTGAAITSGGSNADVFRDSLELCKDATNRIAVLSSELQRRMNHKRFRSSVKVVRKKRDFKSMLEKLDRSKADLNMAYSMYTNARRKAEHKTICRRFDEERHTQLVIMETVRTLTRPHVRDDGDLDPDSAEERTKGKPKKSRALGTETSVMVQIRLPLWLCQYAWDIAVQRAGGTWTASLKTYRIVDFDSGDLSEIFEVDDVDGIRKLLQERQLSIHDQDEHGCTLFSLAATEGKTRLAKFLLESGADLSWEPVTDLFMKQGMTNTDWVQEYYYYDDHFAAGTGPFRVAAPTTGEYCELFRAHAQFLLECYDGDDLRTMEDPRIMSKTPSCWTHEEQLSIYAYRWHMNQDCSLDWFWTIFGRAKLDPDLFRINADEQYTLLHLITINWVVARYEQMLRGNEDCSIWSDLVKQAVRAGTDLHAANYGRRTPLMLFLEYSGRWIQRSKRFPSEWHFEREHSQVVSALHVWTENLAQAGVDLQQYGEAEFPNFGKQLFNSSKPSSSIWSNAVNLTYGSMPMDWRLCFRQPGDGFAGLSWRMIELPERTMPGAWIVDDEEDEEELGVSNRDFVTNDRSDVGVGVKRKTLRRMKAETKATRPGYVDAESPAALVQELRERVRHDAEFYKAGIPSSKRARTNYKRVVSLSVVLGISRPGHTSERRLDRYIPEASEDGS